MNSAIEIHRKFRLYSNLFVCDVVVFLHVQQSPAGMEDFMISCKKSWNLEILIAIWNLWNLEIFEIFIFLDNRKQFLTNNSGHFNYTNFTDLVSGGKTWYFQISPNFCSPGILKLYNPFSQVHQNKNYWVFGFLLGNRKYILQDNPWIDKRQGSSTQCSIARLTLYITQDFKISMLKSCLIDFR